MGLLRYCFEYEKISDTVGARRETLRDIYAIYDRVRGLYDAIAYAPDLEDAQRIVDALNK